LPRVFTQLTSAFTRPLSTIRDTLLRPDPTSTPSPKLRSLLTHHLPRLRSPWSSFTPPSPESRTKLSSSSAITIPHTSSTLEIDDSWRQLALKLSDRIDVDAIECYVLCQSYVAYAVDDERAGEGKLERVMMWYAEEVEAVSGIAEAVLRLSREQEGEEWIELAEQIRAEMLPDPAKYLEGIFRAWSSLAQKPLSGNYRSEHGLFW
jgi:nuclear pore complex protein Nup188